MILLNMTDAQGSDDAWSSRAIPVRDVSVSELTTLVFRLSGLVSGGQYDVKVGFGNASSPVVSTVLEC